MSGVARDPRIQNIPPTQGDVEALSYSDGTFDAA
jgi:hypothetical protein